jgi:hypothetical protein
VQHAVAAHVYKYGANGYQSVGQLGVAVLGTASTKKYKVLAYDAKKTPVATATMHPNFSFTPAANNYASFYDDAQQVCVCVLCVCVCVCVCVRDSCILAPLLLAHLLASVALSR